MTDIRRVGDSGIHTVEGNVAGSRAAGLTKQRQIQAQEYEDVKNKIKQQNSVSVGQINDKFNSGTDVLEQEFKKRTVGLVSADEFRKARSYVDELAQMERDQKLKDESKEKEELKKKDRDANRKKMSSSLSFQMDDEEDVQQMAPIIKKSKILKNPDVDTTFLPDRDRDQALEETKERLRCEWIAQQELVKNEMLEVVYSYWDGSGHRKSIQVKKGVSIGRFLELVTKQLAPEFHDLRMMTAEGLLYVKEDLIIPHQYTFYDLIVTQARGKSGPLFHFDVHDDIRLVNDARIEKDESHPGKIVERRWYERNKHIFPASRWETYDPAVQRDRYTIHGGEVNKSSS